MSRPQIRIHNVETNQVIDREMTEQEYAEHLASIEEDNLRKAEKAVAQAQKQAILDRLGLSEEELRIVLG